MLDVPLQLVTCKIPFGLSKKVDRVGNDKRFILFVLYSSLVKGNYERK